MMIFVSSMKEKKILYMKKFQTEELIFMRKKFNKKTSALAVICAMSILLTGCGNTTDSNRKWSAVSLAENVEAVATDDASETPPSIDTSTLEDCAYALPDPTGADAVAEQ